MVDGFRIDVIWHLIKDDALRDNPPNLRFDPGSMPSNDRQRQLYNADRPEVIEVVSRMRDVLEEFEGERLMIGELYHSPETIAEYYGHQGSGAQMPHNQSLILKPWKAAELRDAIESYLGALPESVWPNWVLSNHDKPRIATRAGSAEQARVARMLLLTLRGTPTLYYGDELGMENVPIPPDEIQDPFEKLDPGRGQGRDPQRTPMQWDGAEPCAGFTTGTPWLRLAHDWKTVNVASQREEPRSMLTLTRDLIALRRAEPALTTGTHRMVMTEGPVIAYRREHESGSFLIALNLERQYATLQPPHGYERLEPVISTRADRAKDEIRGEILLGPDEGVILRKLG